MAEVVTPHDRVQNLLSEVWVGLDKSIRERILSRSSFPAVSFLSPGSGEWTLYMKDKSVADHKMVEDQIRKAIREEWLS